MDPTAGYIGANCSYCDQRFDIEALDHEDHCPACREAVAAEGITPPHGVRVEYYQWRAISRALALNCRT